MTLDDLIGQVSSLDRLAQQVQIDDVEAGARTAKVLVDAYDEWFAHCLTELPEDLREKFRFEYEGNVRSLQYRIKHFLQEPVRPRPKFFGGGTKRPSEWQGLLGYWQHPYKDRFQGPIKVQKQLLLEARARLRTPGAVVLSPPRENDVQLSKVEVTTDHVVRGEAYNAGATAVHVFVRVLFIDARGRIAGTGCGVVNDLAPGRTKPFLLATDDDVTGYRNVDVRAESVIA